MLYDFLIVIGILCSGLRLLLFLSVVFVVFVVLSVCLKLCMMIVFSVLLRCLMWLMKCCVSLIELILC